MDKAKTTYMRRNGVLPEPVRPTFFDTVADIAGNILSGIVMTWIVVGFLALVVGVLFGIAYLAAHGHGLTAFVTAVTLFGSTVGLFMGSDL